MDVKDIKDGQKLAYKAMHAFGTNEGVMIVGQVYKTRTGYRVIGVDKTLNKDVTVRPSQLSKIKRK
jgi:hypothetical protein